MPPSDASVPGGTDTSRVAVVTGGASGIGRATVLRFLDAGFRVVFGDVNIARAENLLAEAETDTKASAEDQATSERLRFLPTGVTDETAVSALVETAVTSFGGLDVMFNNAGVGGAFGPLTELDADDWDRTFAVLTRSVFVGTKHAARAMIRLGRGGSIVNMSSVAGLVGGGGPLAYSAAKAAVVMFTRNAAVELAPHRIRVNAVCPGLIDTPLVMGKNADGLAARLPEIQPWPDLGRPDHVASVVGYLAGPDSEFVTGEAVRVDGGMLAWGPRMENAHDERGLTRRYAGFADGSTGRRGTKRSLGD